MLAMKPEWFVTALGLYLLVLLFGGVLNRMSSVPHPLRCAIALLIVPGVVGKVMGAAAGRWEAYVDILLVGGLALLFTVDRRGFSSGTPTPWRLPAKIAAIGILVAGGLACSAARAEPGIKVNVKDVRICVALSHWVQGAADMRDAGGSLEMQIPIVRQRNLELPPQMVALLVHETKLVYARPQMSPDDLGADAFDRCALGLLRIPGN
jgi:hypothetical protein